MSPDPLVYDRPMHTSTRPPPVVAVGLPRSGSSYLSRVLSESSSLFVFDDLYLRRHCLTYKRPEAIDDDSLLKIREWIYWQLHARIRGDFPSITNLSIADAGRLATSVTDCFRSSSPHWSQIQAELLTRLAMIQGANRWGWKCPGDYRVLNTLNQLFPGLKVVFLHRHPNDVLISRKNVPRDDGDSKSFNPIIQAIYWKDACEKSLMFHRDHPNQLMDISFNDLVNRTSKLDDLLLFLQVDNNSPKSHPVNSSYTKTNRPSPSLCELLIVNTICNKQMRLLGYEGRDSWDRIGGLRFLQQSYSSFLYYAAKTLKDKSRLGSVREFARSVFTKHRDSTSISDRPSQNHKS